MIRTGKLALLLTLALLGFSGGAQAGLQAEVDRQVIALGDTLRLEISATGEEQLNDIDLSPLEEDFQILQRSTRSSMQIINGERTHERQLLLDLVARREGNLLIPPLTAGAARTRPLAVRVEPPAEAPDEGAQVLFEAELDRDSVYVQGQLLLTLRIQQAINLDARSVTELDLDNAFVKPLEQSSYQRTIGGRPWLVHEIRYAIFPEQSGTLDIPAQQFSARISQPRRSLFDRDSGRLIRRSTEPLTVEVKPRPDSFPAGATWLPARDLKVEEQWSSDPGGLQVGESATRTLRLTGEGVQGAQLPPVLFPATPGLKYYPDQPAIEDTETSGGLTGRRTDSAALVPTAAGSYRIPELRIPWWDTAADELREAVIPAREIEVSAAATASPTAATRPAPSSATRPAADAGGTSSGELWLWRGVALLSLLGWLITGGMLWRRGRTPAVSDAPASAAPSPRERQAFKTLLAACAGNNPQRAREALLAWGSVWFDLPGPSLALLLQRAANPRLATAVEALEQHLYGKASDPWQGEFLAAACREVRAAGDREDSTGSDSLALYPGN